MDDCPSSGPPRYVKVNLTRGWNSSNVPCQSWTVTLVDVLLFKTDNLDRLTSYLEKQDKPIPFEVMKVEPSRPYVLQGNMPLSALPQLLNPEDVLLNGYGFTVFQSTLRLKLDDLLSLFVDACQKKTKSGCNLRMKKLRNSMVLVENSSSKTTEAEESVIRNKVSFALQQLSETRFLHTTSLFAQTNQSLSNNNTLNPMTFLVDQLLHISDKIKVHTTPCGSSQCVFGELTGSLRSKEIYVVSADYDTSADNSGVADVLEVAHALSNSEPLSTVIFSFYPGEQGSEALARYLQEHYLSNNVKLVLMMENTGSSHRKALLETSVKHSNLAIQFAKFGEQPLLMGSSEPSLISFHPFDSRGLHYLNLEMPAMTISSWCNFDDNAPVDSNGNGNALLLAKMTTAALVSFMSGGAI